jgi:lauroyl/myristoyl acyltransferase
VSSRTTSVLFGLGWTALRWLPERVVRSQFDLWAESVYRRNGRGVQRLRSNLRRVLGPETSASELDSVTRQAVHSYLRYWCEVFRLPSMSRERIVDRMWVRDEHLLRAAWAAGRGMILALPHTGNWDHAGAWLVHTGVPFTTVAERLKPESLFDRFVQFRRSLGMEVVPLTGGERPPYALLRERLQAGGCLCLLADRDLTSSGVEVSFFGEPARMPAGPAALAFDTGATLLPVTLWYPDEHRWCAWIHPQVVPSGSGSRADQVRRMTQQMADAFAAGIAEHPADWHMLQRVWVADLDPRRLALPAGV